jgi:membrane protein
MKLITTLTQRLNRFQQTHSAIGFPVAVLKKYGDNNGSYQAALLTYYGFLSLFPLLLVVLNIVHLLFRNNDAVREAITSNISTYFPLLGNQLQSSIGSYKGAGVGLAIGLLLALYGARGGADALRFMLDSVWYVPKSRRAGFPKNTLKSLSIMGISAIGFWLTVGASILTSSFDQNMWTKIVFNLLGMGILAASLTGVFYIGLSRRVAPRKMALGAAIAGVVVQLLVTFGGILVARQLKNLDSLYGTFAIVLGLLFWIYLLAQIIVYAAQIDTVRELRLWPRSLDINSPTTADEQAYRLQAKAEHQAPHQKVAVNYHKTSSAKAHR